jgi:phosphoglycolate phosphatase
VRGNIGHSITDAALLYTDGDVEKAARLADAYRQIARDEYLGKQPPLDPLFDGAKKTLSELQKKGYLTGVVTNKSRTGLDSLLGRHGLDELLDVSVSADDCVVKPAPDMAFLAMRQTGVETANTLLVGDTEIDAGCAANAGIGFIGVSWGYHSADRLIQEGALHILTSYNELPDVVNSQFDQ